MSAQQHALHTEVRQLKSRLGPAVLERLAELAGLQIEEDGTVTKLPLDEVLRDNDARVVFAATNSLRDQIFGRPREGMEEAEGKEGLAARLEAARHRVLAVEAEPQTIEVEGRLRKSKGTKRDREQLAPGTLARRTPIPLAISGPSARKASESQPGVLFGSDAPSHNTAPR